VRRDEASVHCGVVAATRQAMAANGQSEMAADNFTQSEPLGG
jgi:hypothetical protein